MDFLNGSFRIGRLFGIHVRVHVLFVIWIAYSLIDAGHAWRWELIYLGMLFGTVLLHEFGHCFGARAVGGDARNILMWPLGGLAYADAPMRPWPQFVMVAAGPLVNVVLGVGSAAVLLGATGSLGVVSLSPFAGPGIDYMTAQWQLYVWRLYSINLMLLAFNLLPVFPFDGGQLFRALVWSFIGLHRATVIAGQMGVVGAILLGMLGVTNRNFLLVGIALFAGITSYQHLQAARGGLITDEFLSTDRVLREKRGRRGWWSRLFRRSSAGRSRPTTGSPHGRPSPNPNPGGWEARQSELERLEAEVDRILLKVSERGIHSLSYTEQQTLERATRERQRREREFERDTKP